jgi:hypothetical protein
MRQFEAAQLMPAERFQRSTGLCEIIAHDRRQIERLGDGFDAADRIIPRPIASPKHPKAWLLRWVDKRTFALRKRRERFLGWNTANDFVIIPGLGNLGLFLDLEKVEVVDELSVRPEFGASRVKIIYRVLAHPCRDGIGIVRPCRRDAFQVMRQAGVDGRLGAGRHFMMQFEEAMTERSGFIVQCPIPRND